MLIFLYGPDTYRSSRKAARIVEEYRKQKGRFDFSVIDAQTDPAGDFLAGLRQASLFQEKKFFVVKNPISNKEFKEALIENIEVAAKSGHNVIFCQEGKVLKNDRLLSAMKKNAQVQEFAALEGADLVTWIVNEFKVLGCRAGAPAAEALASRFGSDLWRLENEIQKLAHFRLGGEVAAADVVRAADHEIGANIFETIDAVAGRDKKQALRLVKERVAGGDHPLYLLAMIASQFKNLVLVKSGGGAARPQACPAVTAARLGIHPYVFGKTVGQARDFGLDELKSAYRRICQTDFDVKTGKVSPEAGIDLLIAGI